MNYEVFKGIDGNRKSYVVMDGRADEDTIKGIAAKLFKVGKNNLAVGICHVWNDQLFYEDPKVKGSKRVTACWRERK